MHRSLFAAVLALGSLAASAAHAQSPVQPDAPETHAHHRHSPHKQVMRLSKELNLSSDQSARLEPILAQRKDQMRALHQNTALSPEQRMTEKRNLNQMFRDQVSAVLTPEQVQQWKTRRKARHHMEREMAAPAPNGI